MAMTMKSIPVLTGDAAERFIRLAEENESSSARTVIPDKLKESIRKMMERSQNIVIKVPK